MRRYLVSLTILGIAGVFHSPAFAGDQEGCLLCHRLELRAASETGGRSLEVREGPGGLHDSLHCSDCHPDARVIPHASSPGPSLCIGECHGSTQTAVATHRRAAYGGLTEAHRTLTSPRSPCLACHASSDPKGDSAAADGRCAGCHRKEARAVREGPHWRMAGPDGPCAGCHPAHRQGSSTGKPPATCSGTGCHSRIAAGMKGIADHRTAGADGFPWGKASVFLAIAASAWGFRWTTRPARGKGGRSA